MTHILVIEDDPLIQIVYQQWLERAGYQVSLASEGGEALKRFKQLSPDLVITDLIMPGMEGIETIIELRKLQPSLKIVAVSGGGLMAPNGYLLLAGSVGANRTLIKPVERHVLLDAVKELIDPSGSAPTLPG